ncbi:hypothetical protein FRC04_001339 [Tulasnella sp. 424]|nr:hypothetical protein FRC04_001339 [Tulasnella sp. 424]
MQRSLEGMKRLREVSWDDSYWVPKPPKEGEPGTNECRQKFWSVVPRLCKGVQTINLLLRPRNENDYCWLCGPLLSEVGNFASSCDELDALITQAQTTQNNIFTAFTGLRELSLKETRLQVLPDLQFPSLIKLSLINVEFEASDGLLRLLESSPGIISLHLDDDGSSMLRQDQNHGGSAPSLAIAPLLKSFRGHYGDAEILFFNPLPNGSSRSVSNLEVLGSTAEQLLPSLITAFKHAEIGAREDLLELKIHTNFDREYDMDGHENESGLLWVSWLRSIVTYCPKLRGLFIEIDDPDMEPNNGDETDGWKPTLAPLKDLAVLKLPASLWEAEVTQGSQEGEAEQHAVEQCLQWFPRLRLFFPADHLVLIINAEENKADTPPTRGRLLDSGQATGRRWNLYEHFFPEDFEEVVKGLIV